jgi:hypothetical protein
VPACRTRHRHLCSADPGYRASQRTGWLKGMGPTGAALSDAGTWTCRPACRRDGTWVSHCAPVDSDRGRRILRPLDHRRARCPNRTRNPIKELLGFAVTRQREPAPSSNQGRTPSGSSKLGSPQRLMPDRGVGRVLPAWLWDGFTTRSFGLQRIGLAWASRASGVGTRPTPRCPRRSCNPVSSHVAELGPDLFVGFEVLIGSDGRDEVLEILGGQAGREDKLLYLRQA